ncbi:MAG: UDP-N-acetylmuramoyl-L-alanyl-D-glutamate--2,6-diaminopimelate ligase [Kofleriaceae bacterium]
MMSLRALFDGIAGELHEPSGAGAAPAAIGAVHDDSRQVRPGDVFVAVRGRSVDGHDFLARVIEAGAAAVVVERLQPGLAVPQLVVADAAATLGVLVGRSHGDPAARLGLVGITGTNGKTTTSYLVEAILRAAGHAPGVIGTVTYRWAGKTVDAPYTTPTPSVLHQTLAQMRGDGVSHVVMETSSAALAMHRLAGVRFACAAFSNLTQDHLDLHGTMDAYRAAKQKLFREHVAGGVAVINVDDPEGDGMVAACVGARRVLRVSTELTPGAALRPSQQGAEIRVLWCESTVRGLRARVSTPSGELEVANHALVGPYNVANVALAIGVAEGLGVPHAAIAAGIEGLAGVPGRVERVANVADLDLLVDYAHTPDALRNVLTAIRPLTARRLLCVFGCGGDRDPGKRPLMGAAVAELADLPVVTSDNPRTEDPQAILDMILPAVPRPFFVHVDRRTAIRAAVAEAGPGDVVVIAGKGHEDYQILGTKKIHFDDREEAAAAAALRPRWTLREVAALTGGALHAEGADAGGDTAVSGAVIDSRAVTPGRLFVAIRGERHDGAAFWPAAHAAGAPALVASAPVPGAATIVVEDPAHALGALGAAHRQWWRAAQPEARLVAITGSSGKTTTKQLTAAALAAGAPTHAAEGSLNNETGLPLSLLGLRAHHRFGVVEMGMRGLGQIEYLTKLARPDVAVVVNAGVAHLELLGTRDAIAQAKGEIWTGLADDGVIVRPADDARLARWAAQHAPRARTLLVGSEASAAGAGADVAVLAHRVVGGGAHLRLRALGQEVELVLPMAGRHVAFDACCALAAALAVGVPVDTALAGLAACKPAAMRGELVEVAGRHVVVDCYNANPASMEASLQLLEELAAGRQVVAVLGDMLELGAGGPAAHAAVAKRALEAGFKLVALGEQLHAAVPAQGAATFAAPDPAAAAARALAWSEPGDFILLKASRGMRLERVLDAMREAVG